MDRQCNTMRLCFGFAPAVFSVRHLRQHVLSPARISTLRSCASAQPATAPINLKTVKPSSIPKQIKWDETRVRFAPSPTGDLHLGGARTALYNYLLAKQKGGKFLIRIEDTDEDRNTRESEIGVLNELKWLGLRWDEGPEVDGPCGPYRQSEREAIYKHYAQKLIDFGQAYPCFCSAEELEEKRLIAKQEGRSPQYDGKWRNMDKKLVDEKLAAGEEHTVRFKIPEGSRVVLNDLVRGRIEWDANAAVGDFIVLRSNGMPTYNFCVTVDDALMGITTVIRGDEHLPNTLRQILTARALGFELPEYAHTSLIINEHNSKKLSKRDGAASVGIFRDLGYLPIGLLNYLATLGWNDGTEDELFTMDEMIERFSVERINATPGKFAMAKLQHMNGLHLRALPADELIDLVVDVWHSHGVFRDVVTKDSDLARLGTEICRGSMDLVNDAVREMSELLSYPLSDTIQSGAADELVAENGGFIELGKAVLQAYDDGTFPIGDAGEDHGASWKKWVKATGKELGRKGKKLFHPLRLALTGKMSGPDVGEVLHVLHLAMACGATDNMVPLDARIQQLRGEIDNCAK